MVSSFTHLTTQGNGLTSALSSIGTKGGVPKAVTRQKVLVTKGDRKQTL